LRADADNVRRGLEEKLRIAPEPLLWPKAEIAASSRLSSCWTFLRSVCNWFMTCFKFDMGK
jgi:hypothetical protein